MNTQDKLAEAIRTLLSCTKDAFDQFWSDGCDIQYSRTEEFDTAIANAESVLQTHTAEVTQACAQNIEAEAWQYFIHGHWHNTESEEPWREKGLPVRPLFAAYPYPNKTLDNPPQQDQRVLYWFEPFQKWYLGHYVDGSFCSYSGFCDHYDAPYWLPLPPSPKQ